MPEKISIRVLPAWAEDLRRRYVRGEASMFVLHGNVFDAVVQDGLRSLSAFLTDVLLSDTKDTIVAYNVATGGHFAKRAPGVDSDDDLAAAGAKDKALAALERLLVTGNRTAVVLEYADAIAPSGDAAFQADADRAAVVTLHRWSFLPAIEKSDNLVILVTENLTDLSSKLVANPRVAVVRVPMPDLEARRAVARLADPKLSENDVARYAAITAGLKAIQIFSILAPPAPALESRADREAFIGRLLGGGPDAGERAHKLATLTAALPREEVEKLLAPGKGAATASPGDVAEIVHAKADQLISGRKREILERECFGLVEFVEPIHGFEVVGGMEEVKSELSAVAENIREGRVSRVPMGILFTGPMGTGKTFVAEAFAKECGLTTIKLKNFRSKWVGATEGNLDEGQLAQPGQGRIGYPDGAHGVPFDEPLVLQPLQGLTDRGRADAQVLGQAALGQPLRGLQHAGRYVLAQRLVGLVGQCRPGGQLGPASCVVSHFGRSPICYSRSA